MITSKITDQDVLRAANANLHQQRRNGRSGFMPQLGSTVAEFLGEVRAASSASLYPTASDLDTWTRAPDTFTDALHESECQGGMLMTQEGDEFLPRPCPRCETTKRRAALRRQLVASGIDGRYLNLNWADLDLIPPLDRLQAACGRIGEIVHSGASLLLWSEATGSGKTQMAMLAATAAVQAGHSAYVANLARLAVDVRGSYRQGSEDAVTEQAALRRLTEAELLVLDDLGAGETDTAAVERRLLFLALDERQMRRRPSIVTTNLNAAELFRTFGSRILARLQPLTIIHVDHGRNFRLDQAADGLW